MSAIQLHRSPGQILVITDTALGYEGKFAERSDKAVFLPRINAVAAFRGRLDLQHMVSFWLRALSHPEQLTGSFPELARSAEALPVPIEFVVGGVDRRGREFAYLFESHPVSGEPFTPQELPGTFLAPMPSLDGFHGRKFESADHQIGWLMQAQRDMPEIIVGGECVAHVVDSGGYTSRLIGHWNDQAGGCQLDKSNKLQLA